MPDPLLERPSALGSRAGAGGRNQPAQRSSWHRLALACMTTWMDIVLSVPVRTDGKSTASIQQVRSWCTFGGTRHQRCFKKLVTCCEHTMHDLDCSQFARCRPVALVQAVIVSCGTAFANTPALRARTTQVAPRLRASGEAVRHKIPSMAWLSFELANSHGAIPFTSSNLPITACRRVDAWTQENAVVCCGQKRYRLPGPDRSWRRRPTAFFSAMFLHKIRLVRLGCQQPRPFKVQPESICGHVGPSPVRVRPCSACICDLLRQC